MVFKFEKGYLNLKMNISVLKIINWVKNRCVNFMWKIHLNLKMYSSIPKFIIWKKKNFNSKIYIWILIFYVNLKVDILILKKIIWVRNYSN